MFKKNKFPFYLELTILFVFFYSILAQAQTSPSLEFKKYYNKSINLNKLSLFSESIKELNTAILIAKENDLEEEYYSSSVFFAEMMRRSSNYKKGLTILENLVIPEKYLKLQVKKLGRMAALYAEGKDYPGRSPKDSLQKIFKNSIKDCKR